MTTERRAMAYIAINRACGCATGIVVDDGLYPKDVAKCVADFIKDGRLQIGRASCRERV